MKITFEKFCITEYNYTLIQRKTDIISDQICDFPPAFIKYESFSERPNAVVTFSRLPSENMYDISVFNDSEQK